MKQIGLLIFSLFVVVGIPFVGAFAEVSININVPPPPPLVFARPPDVVVVPSGPSDVYLVPNTVGLYFFGGFWYRFHGGYWYRGSLYSGPWITIREALVPPAVVVIPPNYILGLPPGYHRIPYADFHSHWRDWGRTHYWNSQPWYRDHALHHWGGREWRPLEKGAKGKPAEAGLHEKGPRGKPGEVKHHEKRPTGGKPGGAEPKTSHPAKHE